ncbi:PAS domain-containing protein [Paucidesulfovibrio longus]|uniref:PAS domain-containing protein n=1 Tax=Paucidesulfovibrio longus TaxID=889 RepID=UPI0003F71F57|nr:PAS domain-containing protein [Paucidesulfovibrio longus]
MHETSASRQQVLNLKLLFGKQLLRLRNASGLSRAALGERAGVTGVYISKMERGLASPSFEVIVRLAEVFGVEPAQFFLREDLSRLCSLSRSENRYQGLFESTPISLWEEDLSELFAYFEELKDQGVRDFRAHFAAHPEGLDECARRVKILNVNQATLDLLKAPDKEALFAGLPQVLTEESHAVFGEEMAVLAEGGREFHGEITHRALDGSPRYLTIHFQLLDDPLSSGRVVVSLIDVTEQKLTENALRLSQARLDRAQEIALFGCFEHGLESGEIYWSDQTYRLFGYAPGAAEPTLDLVLGHIHPDDRPELQARHRNARINGEPFEMVFRIVRASGEIRQAHCRANVERGPDGSPQRLIGAVQDVTEQKRMEQMRRDVERILRHDLQTPLAAAATAARAFKDDENLLPPQRFVLQEIERTTNRVLTMVRRHQDMFRMETGKYVLRPRTVDIVEVGRAVNRELAEILQRCGVGFAIIAGDRPAWTSDRLLVDGDPFLLQTMLSNLVKNAVEASPQGRSVTLHLEDVDGIVRIRVHNHGTVPPAVRGNFFEKYATAGKSQGTGLGTYSARLITRTLGGEIEMRTSEADGTTVTVRLPARAEST